MVGLDAQEASWKRAISSRQRSTKTPPRQKRQDGYGLHQSDFARLAGGTIPFMRKYSTICP